MQSDAPGISRETVVSWLQEMGFSPKDQDDEANQFHLVIDYPPGSGQQMHVVQPIDKPKTVAVVTGTNMAPQHVKAFGKLGSVEQFEFQIGLRQTLNQLEVDYRVEGSSAVDECPDRFQVSVVRYADGLTLDSFAHSIGAVYKTKLKTIFYIQGQLDRGDLDEGDRFDFERLGI